MPRYVLLAHDWPTPHFDLLLECGDVLKSWRLLAGPTPGVTVPAEPNADHRLAYLDYEGEVSGGRGTVRRVAAGEYHGDITMPAWSVTWDGGTAAMTAAGFRILPGPGITPGTLPPDAAHDRPDPRT